MGILPLKGNVLEPFKEGVPRGVPKLVQIFSDCSSLCTLVQDFWNELLWDAIGKGKTLYMYTLEKEWGLKTVTRLWPNSIMLFF